MSGLKYQRILQRLALRLIGIAILLLTFLIINLKTTHAATNPPSEFKVLVVVYNGAPYAATEANLNTLIYSVKSRMEEASKYHGYTGSPATFANIDYQIVDIEIRNELAPQKGVNCMQYIPLNNWTTANWQSTNCWGSGTADYTAMIESNNVCNLVNAGTIDEVWLFGFSNGGFWEANMTGPGAYWTNGPTFEDGTVDCNKAVHVMGLNYQVPVEYAMHSFGHRMESVFRKFAGETVYNDFLSSCGNVHFPPNRPIIAGQDYQYGNTTTVSKDCKTWNPNGVTGTNTNLSCSTWGCTQLGYMDWWFKGIPGANTNLTYANGDPFPNIWALFLREPAGIGTSTCSVTTESATGATQLPIFHAGCPDDNFVVVTASYRTNPSYAALHDIATMQYGSNNMTFGCRSNSNEYATEIWYYNGANPSGATVNIGWDLIYGNVNDVVIGIKSFTDVNTTTPVTDVECTSDNGTWTNQTIGKNPEIILNSSTNQTAIGAVTTYTGSSNNIIPDIGSELFNIKTTNMISSAIMTPGSSPITLSWTGSVNWPWSVAAMSINYNSNSTLTADLSASILIPDVGEVVTFSDESTSDNTNIISWSWDFNSDGIEDSTLQNPTYKYASYGYKDISLTISDGYNTDTVIFNDYILVDDIPQVLITTPNGTVGPEDIIVKNLSNYTIRWTATDVNDTAIIKLYYDTNNSGNDGVRINNNYGTLQFYEGGYYGTSGTTGYYAWNTSNLAAGTYYVYAEISDGKAPVQYDYSDAPIQILNNYQPTMNIIQPNGVGDVSNTAYRIEWQAKDQDLDPATIDLFYYTTATGGTPTLIASNIPFNNGEIKPGKYSYIWNTTALPNGNYYVSATIKDNITPIVTLYRRGPVVVNHSTNTTVPDTFGYRISNYWRLYAENSVLAEIRYLRAGSTDQSYIALKGDWDGDDIDEIGTYKDGYWETYESDGTLTQRPFRFGPAESGWQPITGDWDGDGVDGIGLYKDGSVMLRNIANTGTTDDIYPFGTYESGWQIISGDWNGDGIDTLGIYKSGLYKLSDYHNGNFNYTFLYGSSNAGNRPVAGDWNADGKDSVGYIDNGVWRLTNGTSSSTVTTAHTINMSGLTFAPIVGKWNEGLSLTIESFALSGRNSLSMSWTDSMIGEDASIDIYLDNDDGGNDGMLVAENLSEDNTTDAYTWSATGFTTGDYYVYAKITDSSGSEYVDYSENSVHLVNSLPLITSTPTVRGYANTAYSYTVTSTDADNDGRSYSLVSAPTGMTINASTGSISWTPTTATEEVVVVKVTDTIQTSTEQEFILEVESVTADFTPSGTNGLTPYTLGFDDNSTAANTEITTWSWDFNDDGTIDSTEQNPIHTYTSPGTYTVKLTVGNGTISDSETKTNLITVATMTANFSASVTTGNAPLAVNFTDTSTTTGTTITSWSWDFNNDGVVDSTAQNPSYSYTTPGTYTVKLVVGNGSLTDEEIKFDYIVANTPPVACMQVEYTTIDTYARAGTYANNNYGTETTMYTKDGGTNYDRQSFMRFDLTGTDYTTITSAKLRLHVDDIGMGFTAQPNVRFYDVTSNTWTETGLTWNNKPVFGNTIVTWNALDSQEKTWLEIDMTSYIQAELNGDRIVNIGTWDVNASDEEVEFDTRESTKKPFLEITGVSGDCVAPMVEGTNELDRQVITSHDDGGENLEYTGSGDMSRSPVELYLTRAWGTDDFETAVRFQNITIPQGATIKSAYIEVVSNKLHGSAVNMNIYGHDIDNAPKLEYITDDITNRAKTSAYYNWKDLGVWNLNSAQRTGDLKNVIQEIVDRGGWVSGNAMMFIINGTGDRSVYSVDGSTTYAPKLHIEYDL